MATSTPGPRSIAELAPNQHAPCSSLEATSAGVQLPAPLYFLDIGGIARLERDGVTCALVTNIADRGVALLGFDVSPRDSALVYIGIGCPTTGHS